MAKLKTMASAIGSLKGLNAARAEFDDTSRTLPNEEIYPPADIRPAAGDGRTLLLRVINPSAGASVPAQSAAASQGDTFAIIHVPAANDLAAVLVLNPSTQVESGQTFSTIADEGGWPVIVAMVEEFLGLRVDHVAELEVAALGKVIDELGALPVYSRTAFSAGSCEFVEGTNNLDGTTSAVFSSADPVDDAGQTRTRNQRALLRALIEGLRSGGLVKDPNKGASVLGHFASGIRHDSGLTTAELGKIANVIRQLRAEDIAVVTIPTKSSRVDDGTVAVDFDPEAMPALRSALAGDGLPEFFRYLVSLGY